jgi:hypothetical protein
VFAGADDLDAFEAVWVVDHDPLALGEDSVMDGVSRDVEALGYPGDGQVLGHDRLECSLRPRRDSFTRASAARLASWRHTCPQPGHP